VKITMPVGRIRNFCAVLRIRHGQAAMAGQGKQANRIYDDRGHRMTPSHVRKEGTKYRYYISSALLQGRAKQAGTVSRIPAHEVEALVIKSIRDHLDESTDLSDTVLIQHHVVRVEVQPVLMVLTHATIARLAAPLSPIRM
jgi:hypothetical protein